jgi:hypothetical protein
VETGALLTQAFDVLHKAVVFALLLVLEIGQEEFALRLDLVDQTVAMTIYHRSPFDCTALKKRR